MSTTGFNILIPLERAKSTGSCGRKAVLLGKLACKGFPVPDGFCLRADAYRAHLWSSGARKLARSNPDELERRAIRDAILKSDVPEDVLVAVREIIEHFGDDCQLVVRHSSTDERVAGSVYSTIHGVSGVDGVVVAAKQVWASLWSDEAASLREQKSYTTEPVMAVIVQKMVNSAALGTASTADLETGDLNTAVVSVGDDRFAIDLRTFDIKERPEGAVISSSKAVELAEAALWVRESVGGQILIQWTIDDDRIAILNACSIYPQPTRRPASDPRNSGWRPVCSRPVSMLIQSLPVFTSENIPTISSSDPMVLRVVDGRVCSRSPRPRAEYSDNDSDRIFSSGEALYKKWQLASQKLLIESRADLHNVEPRNPISKLHTAIKSSVTRANESYAWFAAISEPALYFVSLLREMVSMEPGLLPRLLRQSGNIRLGMDLSLHSLAAYAWDAAAIADTDEPCEQTCKFAADYGYAFMNITDAWDPSAWNTWLEDTYPVKAIIAALSRNPGLDLHAMAESAANDFRSASEEAEMLIRKSRRGLGRFRTTLKLARAWVGASCDRYYVHAAVLSSLRLDVMELGCRLVALGIISTPEGVFRLTPDELAPLVPDLSAPQVIALRMLIADRKHDFWLQTTSAVTDDSRNHTETVDEDIPRSPFGQKLIGFCGYHGGVEGNVRIVESFEDICRVQRGDILIADEVYPAWSPLTAIAGAIILKRGTPISPGVSAARDYGIPCVYGVGDIPMGVDSRAARVDGGSGIVEFLP